jgi:spoIIIJ-associated protein
MMAILKRKGREDVREKRDAEFSGKNIEEAISRGLSELNLDREAVEIDIISPGNRGVLGIGAEDARVSLGYSVEISDSAKEPESHAEEPVTEREPAVVEKVSLSGSMGGDEIPGSQTDDFSEAEQLSIEVVGRLLEEMGIEATVVSLPPQGLMAEQAGEGRAILLDMRGDDLGVLIGRRGESLQALQYITRLIVSHRLKRWLNIILDVEQYRVRREQGLRQLALSTADRVVSTNQSVPLEAMTPYDRRVVHLTLHENEYVTTKSIGEGDNRKVVIIPRKNVNSQGT